MSASSEDSIEQFQCKLNEAVSCVVASSSVVVMWAHVFASSLVAQAVGCRLVRSRGGDLAFVPGMIDRLRYLDHEASRLQQNAPDEVLSCPGAREYIHSQVASLLCARFPDDPTFANACKDAPADVAAPGAEIIAAVRRFADIVATQCPEPGGA